MSRDTARISRTCGSFVHEQASYGKQRQNLTIDAFSQGKIDATIAELQEERDAVKHLLP